MAEFFFNNVSIVGRAGSDTEIKYFNSGKAKANVNIAVSRYVGSGNTTTDWFRVEFWEKDAERASEYIKKGMQVAIDGRAEINRWTNNSGQEQEMLSITATNFRLLSSKKEMEAISASGTNF